MPSLCNIFLHITNVVYLISIDFRVRPLLAVDTRYVTEQSKGEQGHVFMDLW